MELDYFDASSELEFRFEEGGFYTLVSESEDVVATRIDVQLARKERLSDGCTRFWYTYPKNKESVTTSVLRLREEDITSSAFRHGLTVRQLASAAFNGNRSAFAHEIYQLGRQHQRESDAELCVKSDRYRGDYFAKAIRNNTGDPKCQNPK